MKTTELTTTEGNRLFAQLMGYYQPKNVQDDLFSFEVYSSIEQCKFDYPSEDIVTYYGDDIEYFTIIDDCRYHTSWDWIMPVAQKCVIIAAETYEDEWVSRLHEALESFDIETLAKECIEFIQWHVK